MSEPEHTTPQFEETLKRVGAIVSHYQHGLVLPEHLLLALLDDPDAADMFSHAKVNTKALRGYLEQWLEENEDLISDDGSAETSPEMLAVIKFANDEYYTKARRSLDGGYLLASMVLRAQPHVTPLLAKSGLTNATARLYVESKLRKLPAAKKPGPSVPVAPAPAQRSPYQLQLGSGDLRRYCTNLNERAQNGKIEKLIGREEEVTRSLQVLMRRKKNNPMLVGNPGVGKTAIAEGLAKLIVDGKVPEQAAQMTIFSLDMGALVAGTRYRGDFEERLKNVMEEIKRVPGGVLFIDEIHTLIGAGAASGGTLDGGNILKPALQNGDITCIGATTYEEYRNFERKDKALMRRFEKIDVPEPSVAETKQILHGIIGKYEEHHHVVYEPDAVDAAAELSDRYIHGRKKLPDKAIDVIDEAGSLENLSRKDRSVKTIIGLPQIEKVVAKMARMPSQNISRDEKTALAGLAGDLKKKVFDQDPAMDALAAKVKMARAGLRDLEKPIGCYVFSGPTGVGKTEAAKQLSETLGMPLKRFDMSEYMEKHTVSRLIGAPPGYVGHDQGGLLTEAIDQAPYSILLLDEIEKAHKDIYNILLQVMDHGKLTDTHGKEVSFRNVIIIMTTNAGAEGMQKKSSSMVGGLSKNTSDVKALEALFPPEFRNRLDGVISFSALEPSTMHKIIGKFIGKLEAQLKERNVELELTQEAREYLAREGYDKKMGARPLSRVIDRQIREPLSDEILNGKLQDGGAVKIEFNDAAGPGEKPGLKFTFSEASEEFKKQKKTPRARRPLEP